MYCNLFLRKTVFATTQYIDLLLKNLLHMKQVYLAKYIKLLKIIYSQLFEERRKKRKFPRYFILIFTSVRSKRVLQITTGLLMIGGLACDRKNSTYICMCLLILFASMIFSYHKPFITG